METAGVYGVKSHMGLVGGRENAEPSLAYKMRLGDYFHGQVIFAVRTKRYDSEANNQTINMGLKREVGCLDSPGSSQLSPA